MARLVEGPAPGDPGIAALTGERPGDHAGVGGSACDGCGQGDRLIT
jgi:hypothetical protein